MTVDDYNHQNYYEFDEECGNSCYLIKQNKVVYMKTEKTHKKFYINKQYTSLPTSIIKTITPGYLNTT